ncbi:BamA/TamA family outer membrane protein [Sanyastnella coralliicola]|uniref:BamA/TamA family outer membrane protein n=1 Tax=Sanyastnella coralliicola TaxID=3069118 RepID=UPI0027B9BD5A|nr:BamA/TamA family outer membrane protein [Longitalea sp. SCSIO 12813]
MPRSLSFSFSLSFLFFLFSFLFLSTVSFGQEEKGIIRLWNRVFNDTTHTAKPKFIAYPVVAFTPETSWEFGASALYVYNPKRNLENRLSEISIFSFVTLKNQYGLYLDHAIYTDQNDYFLLGKFRVSQFPLLYHGVGIDTPEDPIARIDGFSITLRERVLRKIKENFYAGVELDLNHFSSAEVFEPSLDFIDPTGLSGFTNFGIGLGLVYDERYNVLNPREGLFAEGGFLHYSQDLVSDYNFTNYFLDVRYYHPTFKNQVLAGQLLINAADATSGSDVPFNQLSLMGGENLMRGYYLGRYRDRILVASQLEYRFLPFPFSRRFGGTIFGGVGAISPNVDNLNLDQVRASGGLGLRFLLFPGKDIYTRFDVAATNEGLGYYLFIGEAF